MRALTFPVLAVLAPAALFLVLASAAAAAAPAFPAAETAVAIAQAGGEERDVWPVAAWTLVGTFIFALVFGILYLFKRRVGGFPKHPDWVAPISIERSETLPREGDYADVSPGAPGAHH
jgi:hypothetical protein